MNESAWRRRAGRRWLLAGIVLYAVYLLVAFKTDGAFTPFAGVFGGLGAYCLLNAADQYGWASGWDAYERTARRAAQDRFEEERDACESCR